MYLSFANWLSNRLLAKVAEPVLGQFGPEPPKIHQNQQANVDVWASLISEQTPLVPKQVHPDNNRNVVRSADKRVGAMFSVAVVMAMAVVGVVGVIRYRQDVQPLSAPELSADAAFTAQSSIPVSIVANNGSTVVETASSLQGVPTGVNAADVAYSFDLAADAFGPEDMAEMPRGAGVNEHASDDHRETALGAESLAANAPAPESLAADAFGPHDLDGQKVDPPGTEKEERDVQLALGSVDVSPNDEQKLSKKSMEKVKEERKPKSTYTSVHGGGAMFASMD
jgi:hypothetical protein